MAKGIIDIHIKSDMNNGELNFDIDAGDATVEQVTEVFSVVIAQLLRQSGDYMNFEQMALLTKLFGQKLYFYSNVEGDITID